MNNSTQYSLLHYLKGEVIQAGVTSLVGLCGFIFNTMVCFIIFTNKSLRKKPLNRLIANLALSDLIHASDIGATYLFRIVTLVDYRRFQNFPVSASAMICRISLFLIVSTICNSSLTLAMISYERFRAIVYPFSTPFSKRKISLMLTSSWLMGCIAGILVSFIHGFIKQFPYICRITSKNYSLNAITAIIFSFFCSLLPLSVIIVCYAKIIIELCHKSMPIDSSRQKKAVSQATRKKYTSIVTVLLITIITATTSSPFVITYTIYSYRNLVDNNALYFRKYSWAFWKYFQASAIILLIPCSINPILYNFASSTFQKEVRTITRKLLNRYRKNSSIRSKLCT